MKTPFAAVFAFALVACAEPVREEHASEPASVMRPPDTIATDDPAGTSTPPPPSENAGATDRRTPAAADDASP